MKFRLPVIIGFVLIALETHAESTECRTQSCVQSAAELYRYIDDEIDPCDDFYAFTCGTFLMNAHGDGHQEFEWQLLNQYEHERIALYTEEIREDDHKLVKFAKKLYQSCLNENQVEEDAVKTLKEVFEQVGGWPVLEGSNWKEDNFNWLDATYKLRKLGYHSGVFVDLDVIYDSEGHRHTLELSYGDYDNEKFETMVDIAMKFDLENRDEVVKDLKDAYNLSQTIYQMWWDKPLDSQVLTLKEIKEKVPDVDWVEFVNHIAGTVIQVTEDDKISFMMDYLQPLMELLAKTPKRTLANLMMWDVLKDVVPYFVDDSVNPDLGRSSCRSRGEFCLHAVADKFYPDPIEVTYNRRHLSSQKKQKIEEMANSMKTIATEMISDAEWLSEDGKKQMLDKFKSLEIQIGLPGDFFNDKIFELADVDLVDVENGTFFDYLARAKRNSKASEYKLVKESDNDLHKLHYWLSRGEGYQYTENIIYVPAYRTTDMVYDESRPQYINFGIMGMQLGSFMNEMLCVSCLDEYSEKSKEFMNLKRKCVQDSWHGDIDEWSSNKVLATNIAQQVAYEAYQKWVNAHGPELKLITVDYTPNQLFWIAASVMKCSPIPIDSYWAFESQMDIYNKTNSDVNLPTSWNHKFMEDFKCSEKSNMHAEENCKLF